MTREEILKDYDVDSTGIIRSPGRFEGEPAYTPYFWNLFLDKAYADDVVYISVTEEDRAEFPELIGVPAVRLTENDQGFVYCSEEK